MRANLLRRAAARTNFFNPILYARPLVASRPVRHTTCQPQESTPQWQRPSIPKYAAGPAADTVPVIINGRMVEAPANGTVLDACKANGVYIPTLCHHPLLPPSGSCRLCMVQVKGNNKLSPSCATDIEPGMEILTDTPEIHDSVRSNLWMLARRHPNRCGSCEANYNCEFQDLLFRYQIDVGAVGVGGPKALKKDPRTAALPEAALCHDTGPPAPFRAALTPESPPEVDYSSPSLDRDMSKCVMCYRCVRACGANQGMGVLGIAHRGDKAYPSVLGKPNCPPGVAESYPISQTECINCGACVAVCPVGALHEKTHFRDVQRILANKENKVVIVQTAPAVRVAISELFGAPSGTTSTGQLVTALKTLGFDYVFDTNFTADLTIMEEGTEFLGRLSSGGPFPMFTSCCPAWINMVERKYPKLIPHLSTAKSPQGMLGALSKTYVASKLGVAPENVVVVSIMPCVAKKDEAQRPQLAGSGGDGSQDVDFVLTTRELGTMIRMAKVPYRDLPETAYDSPMGLSTGAAVIFGNTGGVMVAALRTAYEIATEGQEMPNFDFTPVEEVPGAVEASIDVGGTTLNVAVASSGSGIQGLLSLIDEGKRDYHFVEMMSCNGGCVGGAGNPKYKDKEVLRHRAAATYSIDEQSVIRKSHENPDVGKLYEDFLSKPCGEVSHHLLHTRYTDRTPPSMSTEVHRNHHTQSH